MIGSLIKLDDLYWDEKEKRYTALNSEQIEKIIAANLLDDDDKERDIHFEEVQEAVAWATSVRTDYLLLQGILAGRIRFYLDDDDEFRFYEVDNDIRKDD